MRPNVSVVFVSVVVAVLPVNSSLGAVRPDGSFETEVRIEVPSFYGLEPGLRLTYNSLVGSGWLGVGWALDGVPEIRRTSKQGGVPEYGGLDRFYLEGMELIPCSGVGPGNLHSPSCRYKQKPQHHGYATRIESFQRIAFDSSYNAWLVWSKDGTRSTYAPRQGNGFTELSSFSWHLSAVEDPVGHVVSYSYDQSADIHGAGEEYLKQIKYGPITVRFITEMRPDAVFAATGNALLATRSRLKAIDVTVGGQRLRAYALKYTTHTGSGRSTLASVQEYGRDAVFDPAGTVISGTALPPIKFGYGDPVEGDHWMPRRTVSSEPPPAWDGLKPNHVFPGAKVQVERGFASTTPPPLFHTGDFDGDGRTDGLLAILKNPYDYDPPQLMLTVSFADGRTVQSTLILPHRSRWYFDEPPFDGRSDLVRVWVADVNGDGRSDLIILSWDNVDPNNRFGTQRLELNTALSDGDGNFRLASTGFQRTSWQTDTLFGDARGVQCQPNDVNGDGKADFVCLFQKFDGNQFLGTALSLGDGSFDLSPIPLLIADDPNGGTMTAGNRLPLETRSTAGGDVNADGLGDIEILDLRPSDVHACPSNFELAKACDIHYDLLTAVSKGDGTYQLVRTTTDWTREHGLLSAATLYAADLNGDGKADYLSIAGATKTTSGQALRELRTAVTNRNGGLTLTTQDIPAALMDRENLLTVGDFDGDGKTDLLVAAPLVVGPNCSGYPFPHPVLARIRSNGDGTFALPSRWDDCSVSEEILMPWSDLLKRSGVQAADTNGDSLADFMLAFGSKLNDSTVEFSVLDSVSHATGKDTARWISADITGDGREDFVYISSQRNSAFIHALVHRKDGGYDQLKTSVPVFQNAANGTWRVLDLNGDGRADLVHIECTSLIFIFPLPFGTLQLDSFLSNGDGTFRARPRTSLFFPGGCADVSSWRTMDVNGDGRTDLVHLSWSGSTGMFFPPSGAVYVKTLLSNGDGTWAEQPDRGPFAPRISPFELFPGNRLQDTQSWRVMDVDGDGRADLVRVGVNGLVTQISTLLARNQSDWVLKDYLVFNSSESGWDGVNTAADTINWRVVDVNGDGKADLVHLGRTTSGLRIHTLLSKGNGEWETLWQDPVFAPPVDYSFLGESLRWMVTDANGDGRSDLVHITSPGLLVRLDALLSKGDGSWSSQTDVVFDPTAGGDPVTPSWTTAEADGNARKELLRVDLSIQTGPADPPRLHVATLVSRLPFDLLVGSRSLGGGIQVEYQSSSQFSLNSNLGSSSGAALGCSLPLGTTVQVVSATSLDDGRAGGHDRATYHYECPVWAQSLRSFLGWRELTTTRPAVQNRDEDRTTTVYAKTEECLSQVFATDHHNSTGKVFAGRDVFTYVAPGGEFPYHCMVSRRTHLEYGSSGNPLGVAQEYAYDEFGNVVEVRDYGMASARVEKRSTARTFRPATTPYIVGLPAWEGVFEGFGPVAALRRSTFFCYDHDDGSVLLHCLGSPTRGQLTSVQRLADSGLYANTKRFYDARGNLIGTMSPRGFRSSITYDQRYSLYPEKVCDALNHCTTLTWDAVLGRINQVKDINGALTSVSYDALGRMIKETYPSGASATRQYLDFGDPYRQRTREALDDGSAAGLWSEAYFDGLGRAYREVKRDDAAGGAAERQFSYTDSSSNVFGMSDWARSGAPIENDESFTYDGAGRLVLQTHKDGSHRSWSYDANEAQASVVETDELGRAKQVNLDAYGRPMLVRQSIDQQTVDMSFSFDALDRPVTLTDAAGNVTTNTWDMLGHKTRMEDPNLGARKATYDDDGNIVTSTDAANATIAFRYDAIDRLREKIYPNGSKTVWRFDQPRHGASQGRLTSIIDPSASQCPGAVSENRVYDRSGTVTVLTKCVAGRRYATRFDHDALLRMTHIVYPDGEDTRYTYDSASRVASMPGIVASLAYDPAGRVVQASYANGTTTSYTYDSRRRWLSGQVVVGPGTAGPPLYDVKYSYYPTGLLRSAVSTTNRMNLAYFYDELDRLRQVDGDLTQRFDYDSTGNMRFNSAVGAYTYPTQGPVGCSGKPCPTPHAVVAAGTKTFLYDTNGNLSSVRDSNTGKVRRLGWTPDNKPSVMTDFDGTETRYVYDGSLNLASTQNGTNLTRFFGPLFEESLTGGLLKHYYAAGMIVARAERGHRFWYHNDERGSTRVITDESGRVAARFDFAPYGRISASSGSVGEGGFAGHPPELKGGLIYMNARFYDPELGRFLSSDTTVPNQFSTQACNRYSYAFNNPVTFTDPSGHDPTWITYSFQDGSGANLLPPPSSWPGPLSSADRPPSALSFAASRVVIYKPTDRPSDAQRELDANQAQRMRGSGPCPVCHDYVPPGVPIIPVTRAEKTAAAAVSMATLSLFTAPVFAELAEADVLLNGSIWAYGKAPWFWNVLLALGHAYNGTPQRTAEELTAASVADKLERYLLNPDHELGGDKAVFFERALGFTRANAEELARQIKFNPKTAFLTEASEFGPKFNQVITIVGANGRSIDVTFGWIRNSYDGIVRLTTAIPPKK